MKIAFVNQPWSMATLAAQGGSIAILTHEMARRLASSDDVVVYARRRRSPAARERDGRLEYRHVPVLEDYGVVSLFERSVKINRVREAIGRRIPRWWTVPPRFTARTYALRYIVRIALDLKRQACDVVHLHNFAQFAPVIRAINPRAVIAVHMHCEWLTQLDPKMIRARLKDVDLILGCSEYITGKIREKYPDLTARCRTLYNGVDVHRFAPGSARDWNRKDGGNQLLFVGRVSPEKGVHVLVKAFEAVVERMPECRLTVVGGEAVPPREFIVDVSDDPKVSDLGPFFNGRYLADLRRGLTSRVAERILFTGNVAHQELAEHYQRADVFVVPSLCESFPLVVLEAMAAGLPVVATRSGGIPECVEEGKTGILVERGDVPALAEAMLEVLANRDLRRAMGEAGRRRTMGVLSFDRMTAELRGHYQEAVARRRELSRS
jgi:glycosyltransferase involved in cell wall biosynthesis